MKLDSFFISIFSIMGGVLLSYGVIHFVTQSISSDFSRTKFLLDELHSENKYDALILGNSVVMNGVNANLIEENTNLIVGNFSSSGQGILESMLFYQEIPINTKKVIQFIHLNQIFTDKNKVRNLDYQVIQNFHSFGYKPNEFTKSLLDDESNSNFEVVQQGLNFKFDRIKFHGMLSNGFRETKNSEIKSPFIYTQNSIDAEKLNQQLKLFEPKSSLDSMGWDLITIGKIFKSKEYFEKKGIDYTVILHPIHPRMNFYDALYKTLDNEIVDLSRLNVVDFTRVLSVGDFYDHAHPNANGRMKMSLELAKIIN